MAERKTFC